MKMFAKFIALLALVSTVYSVEYHIKNNSPDIPVFIQVYGTEYVEGFILQGKEERILTFCEPWSGRIWGRIDCYSDEECDVAGPIPVSLAEFMVGNGIVVHDLSLVDGFNINLATEPIDGHGDGTTYSCQKAECTYPILSECPEELKLLNAQGVVVSCQSACKVFQTDLYCCRGDHSTPETCNSADWPVDYASWFKERCPNAYSYGYDVEPSTYYCDTNQYIVSFLV